MRIEQRNGVEMPRINRNETMIAHKQPALDHDSHQSSLMPEEQKRATPSATEVEKEERATEHAKPQRRHLVEKADQSSIRAAQKSNSDVDGSEPGGQPPKVVGSSTFGVASQEARAEGRA